jgi:hypothetical protein
VKQSWGVVAGSEECADVSVKRGIVGYTMEQLVMRRWVGSNQPEMGM